MNATELIKPIVWRMGKNRKGQTVYNGPCDLMQIYECPDKTWRVWFGLGHRTSEADDRKRDIANFEEAAEIAQKWWSEWLMQFLEL
jgi:hypothetical protein